MSLRHGVHTVTVRPTVKTMGPRGELVASLGEPVEYSVNVQPVSSSEAESLGMQVSTLYRVKYFPQAHGGVPWVGGAYSRITWNGREFDQQGEAMVSSMSPRTGHVKILMAARSSAVK